MNRHIFWLSFCLVALTVAFSPVRAQEIPITTSSEEARAYFDQGVELFGQHHRWRGSFQRAVEADATFGFALALQIYTAVVPYGPERQAQADRAVELTRNASMAEHDLAVAIQVLGQGEYERAKEILERLVEGYPDSFVPVEVLGGLYYFGFRDYVRAEEVWRMGSERFPMHSTFPNALAYALKAQGRIDEGEAVHRDVVRRFPDEANPYDSLGDFYANRGRYKEAAELYEQALQRDPDWQGTRNDLGYIYIRLGRYGEAEEAFSENVRRFPDVVNSYNSLGELYLVTGRYDEAQARFEKALQIDPDFAVAKNNLARVHIERANQVFEQEFARLDAAAMGALYTADGQLLPAGSGVVEGNEAIGGFWQDAFNAGLTGAELETVEVIAGADGVSATEVGRYRLIAGDLEADTGKYVVIWRRTPEGWRLYRDIWTTDRASGQ